ncbi:zinc finger MYM-type protein 1-like [Acyrthosiphon pisum]|uniref:HAT C-terminal dimerisation domain-containing protein n=1 Tax=Acyrthosiphon pisum TaxID=7029 RepID=A0A8R2NQR6_ACYPI|nr:zinc finger MYM-type protein 1-like [Acyrthosiphon pisum]
MLLKMLCCLPVSTSTPERSFSGLKRIKTYLRNSMKEDRLDGLVLLSYYRNVVITPDEVLNEMAKKPRKIDLVYNENIMFYSHYFDVLLNVISYSNILYKISIYGTEPSP